MIMPKKVELIDRDELIEILYRSDCSTREKIADVVYSQPVVAVVKPRFEIEMMMGG